MNRWKDEHERLRNQLLHKDRQMDEERSELMSANYKKLEESQREKTEEIERLKEIHRYSTKLAYTCICHVKLLLYFSFFLTFLGFST